MDDYFLETIQNEVSGFKKKVGSYCKSYNKQYDLDFFLNNRNEGQIMSDNLNYLMSGKYPKYLLYNSGKFERFIKNMDSDFRNDILRNVSLNEIRNKTSINSNLYNYIKNELKSDFAKI